MQQLYLILKIILIIIISIIGDISLKKAGHHPQKYLNQDFFLGLTIYSLTAFLWVLIYKSAKFSIAGIIYSVLSILFFAFVGIFMFQEKLSLTEYLGIFLAIISILLLSRYA